MRLWHKDLISVLPDQQLIGQWRECCAIARNIAVKGTPNHLLVNKVMDYPIEHFEAYTILVYVQLTKRGYKCKWNNFKKWIDSGTFGISHDELFADWHDDRYLKQCFYNLQEKCDCDGMNYFEYEKILNLMCKKGIKI